MGAQEQVSPIEESSLTISSKDQRDIKKKISDTHTSELIIGLCGPIGTDIHFLADRISHIVSETFDYTPHVIKLSKLIKNHTKGVDFDSLNENDYRHKLIEAGNALREKHGNNILAQLAINEIAVNRETIKAKDNDDEFKAKRICYIIDSIKRPEELELFRLIYRDIFYFFGSFSSLDTREIHLENKGLSKDEIYKLIDRDSGEEVNSGQKVSSTFNEADFFLRINKSTSQTLDNKLLRIFNIIFKTEVITPSSKETAMYLASAAAGNSACLSRQVGASITDKDGNVLSVGWNDVPKSGGNVYQFNESDSLGNNDYRCMNLNGGICFNDREKSKITKTLVNDLISTGLVNNSKKQELENAIKNSRIKELIEFSRAVHAEMLAIIHASQKSGSLIIGGKLFCTTYPCHNCARHIVAAGIKEIYYIEPYRKSLAIKLHSDSITEDESKNGHVRILMYEGVSPRRYLEFFKMSPNPRKRNGVKISEAKKKSIPKNTISLQAIPILEKEVTKTLRQENII